MSILKKNILEELAEEALKEIRAEMANSGTNASGKTAAGLFHVTEDDSLELYSNRKGFANVEAGQNPGKRPRNFRDIILEWIKVKGIKVKDMPYSPKYKGERKFSSSQERGIYYAAGAIAWRNKTKGSLLFREGGRNDIFSPAVDKLVKKVTNLAGDRLAKQIDVIFINSNL